MSRTDQKQQQQNTQINMYVCVCARGHLCAPGHKCQINIIHLAGQRQTGKLRNKKRRENEKKTLDNALHLAWSLVAFPGKLEQKKKEMHDNIFHSFKMLRQYTAKRLREGERERARDMRELRQWQQNGMK